jgi:transcriptional regulator with XRE-family HTH domain
VHDAPSEFARLLAEIKRDAGLTDQAVADAAGVDRSQAWRWAHGSAPGYEPVRRLAAWLIAERPRAAAAARALLPAAGYETPPGMEVPAPPAAARPPAPEPDPGVRAHLYAALSAANRPLRDQILADAAAGVPFTDPVERVIWDSPDWSDEEKAEEIANYRARKAELRGGAGGTASAGLGGSPLRRSHSRDSLHLRGSPAIYGARGPC